MRIRLIAPKGTITPEITMDALCLVGARVSDELITQWTHLECLLAYDWAIREHLYASDSSIKRRPCPHFVEYFQSCQVAG